MGLILVFKKNFVYHSKFNLTIHMSIFDLFTLVTGAVWSLMVVIAAGLRLGSRTLIVLSVELVNIAPGE